MHHNFYHWHKKVHLNPDAATLTVRWDAARKFALGLDKIEACQLVLLALSTITDISIAGKLTTQLLKADPTFPNENNREWLRVMATAGIYSIVEDESPLATAIALASRSSLLREVRNNYISKDIIALVEHYLIEKSNEIRCDISIASQSILTELKSIEEELEKVSSEKEDGDDEEEAQPDYLLNISQQLTQTISLVQQLGEEYQFLWWLTGKRSSLCKRPRRELTASYYAPLAAHEAFARISIFPPPTSIQHILAESIDQCKNKQNAAKSLISYYKENNDQFIELPAINKDLRWLTPLATLFECRKSGVAIKDDDLEKYDLTRVGEIEASEFATEYLTELAFLKTIS